MTRVDRTISFKPTFLKELGKLPANHQLQVLAKVGTLATNPEPEAKTRKRLKGVEDGLCRLRSGDYRVFYSYDVASVSLYSVRRRSEDTYDAMPDAIELAHGTFETPAERTGPSAEDWRKWVTPPDDSTPLPEPITIELLESIGVPRAFRARLLACETQENLLSCTGVPDEYLLAIDQHMFVKPIELVMEEPTLLARGGVDDLLRFTEGRLVGFLLKLDPDQERYVAWDLNAPGPTLLRGGPGTGKTTVALYRVRGILRRLCEDGNDRPRILFATYTNALVTFSRQLLESLLGDEIKHVDVRTADSLVGSILGRAGESSARPGPAELASLQQRAWEATALEGNAIQVAAQRQALDRLGTSRVFEEIEVVIHGRSLESVEQYLATSRPGRRFPLEASARRAIWAVARAYDSALAEGGYETWEQARGRAARLVKSGECAVGPYGAVIVDEAQDLDFNALVMLVGLCADPTRLFLAADENQSIYPAGFAWDDVREQFRFDDPAGVLRLNHRSTRQIVEAANGYLCAEMPDDVTPDPQKYRHEGPWPAVRSLADVDAEADLVARYLRGATRELRLTIGSGAVFTPTNRSGRRLAEALERRCVPAAFHDSRSLELDDNKVMVLPLRAAKGLEFPVVAVAGFIDSPYPELSSDWDADLDRSVRERRTLYVAMTRAMRALLVVTPEGNPSTLFSGFDPELWNTGSA